MFVYPEYEIGEIEAESAQEAVSLLLEREKLEGEFWPVVSASDGTIKVSFNVDEGEGKFVVRVD